MLLNRSVRLIECSICSLGKLLHPKQTDNDSTGSKSYIQNYKFGIIDKSHSRLETCFDLISSWSFSIVEYNFVARKCDLQTDT